MHTGDKNMAFRLFMEMVNTGAFKDYVICTKKILFQQHSQREEIISP